MEDTIAAISSPAGEGGIGIIRVSGPLAEKIGMDCLAHSNLSPLRTIRPRQVAFGSVIDRQGQRIDEAVYFLFKSPKSYTREDLLEIQLHGNRILLQRVLQRIIECGARLAEPGEFTKRAYINGRIDLTQAEALIDLIRARTERGGQVASKLLAGDLSKKIVGISSKLTLILAELEASLDYPEEDIIPLSEVTNRLTTLQSMKDEIQSLIHQGNVGKLLRDGVDVVLVGRPNVGKSSLMNAFLQEERAIVTDIPGTTRDVIIESVEIWGIPVNIVDTAGLHETDHPIERMGINRTHDWIDRADLILFILENNSAITDEDWAIVKAISNKRWMAVINKTDQPSLLNEQTIREIIGDHMVINISAQDRTGFKELEKAIFQSLDISEIEPDQEILVTRIRHKKALEAANRGIQSAIQGMSSGVTEDLLAVELRIALQALGELTGENANEQVIDAIFANYCLGK